MNIRFLIIPLTLWFSGCTKPPPDYVTEQRTAINQDLGSGAKIIQQVNPPIGPFHLVSRESLYYHAVARDGRDYYVESYVSAWTIGAAVLGDDKLVYRRKYYHKILGLWIRTLE